MPDRSKEHDPSACLVCRRLGDFASAPDTLEWLRAHGGTVQVEVVDADTPVAVDA